MQDKDVTCRRSTQWTSLHLSRPTPGTEWPEAVLWESRSWPGGERDERHVSAANRGCAPSFRLAAIGVNDAAAGCGHSSGRPPAQDFECGLQNRLAFGLQRAD